MKLRILFGVAVLAAAGIVVVHQRSDSWHVEVPRAWKETVRTKGQYYPIPDIWVASPEGRIAHDLVLPAGVPRPVPFDFDKARGPWYWPKTKWEVANAYFQHLCRTEAGEWIFERPKDVEGLYFARPASESKGRYLDYVYGPEAPAVESMFRLTGESLQSVELSGGLFVSPPHTNYRYVEEPIRNVKWAAGINEAYVRLFGRKTHWESIPGSSVASLVQDAPMQVIGIPAPSAKYAYTWRGITRPFDREYQIAGNELIVYERNTNRVIAVSRGFEISKINRRRGFSAAWELARPCQNGTPYKLLFVRDFLKGVLIAKQD